MGEISLHPEETVTAIKDEAEDEYFQLVIEVDEAICRYLATLGPGSLLAVSELVALATKHSCAHCGLSFYSSLLFQEHLYSHLSFGSKVEDEEAKLDEENNDEDRLVVGHTAVNENASNNNDIEGLCQNPPHTVESCHQESLNTEFNLKSKRKKIECAICFRKFANQKFYNDHICHMESNNGNFECQHCGKIFLASEKKNYKYHMTNHQRTMKKRKDVGLPTVLEYCHECNVSIPSNSTMERHRIFYHDAVKRCQDCPRQFASAHELREHEKTHWYERYVKQEYSCEICGEKLKSKYTLKYHIQNMHTSADKAETHICDICGRGFKLKGTLHNHKQNVHGEKKFPCTFEGCDRRFSVMRKLRDHINEQHLNIRPYQCNICGQSFTKQKLLGMHVKIHSDERTHICPFCKKGFKQSATLFRHKRSCSLNPHRDLSTSNKILNCVPKI